MSVNFSTITPMNQSTISKPPAFSTAASATAEQPAASSPTMGGVHHHKKSHWFRNTIIGLVILAAGATALRGKVGMFKDFDKAAKLAEGAKPMEKIAHYGKQAVAVVGDFIMTYANKAYEWGKGLLKGGKTA